MKKNKDILALPQNEELKKWHEERDQEKKRCIVELLLMGWEGSEHYKVYGKQKTKKEYLQLQTISCLQTLLKDFKQWN